MQETIAIYNNNNKTIARFVIIGKGEEEECYHSQSIYGITQPLATYYTRGTPGTVSGGWIADYNMYGLTSRVVKQTKNEVMIKLLYIGDTKSVTLFRVAIYANSGVDAYVDEAAFIPFSHCSHYKTTILRYVALNAQ